MKPTQEQIDAALRDEDFETLAAAYRAKCEEADEMQKALRHYEIKLHESGKL